MKTLNTTYTSLFIALVCLTMSACKKGSKTELGPAPNEKPKPELVAVKKKVTYKVKGTAFRMNFIDSTGVFQRNRIYTDSLTYEFNRGSGASIGISVFKYDDKDVVYKWEILINGKVQANSESVGGAYFTVPYN